MSRKEGFNMQISISSVIMICFLVFLAGFVDSIAGGGGLISLPAYIFAGLPAHYAYGTNKFSAAFGTFFSSFKFIKANKIHLKSAVVSAVGALIGSHIGAKIALSLSDIYLRYCLIVMLPIIAVFVLTRRNFGEKDAVKELPPKKVIILSAVTGLVIGAYDGFFGPGTGTFLILIYTSIIGFDIITASGNAKIVNLASNVSALITFINGGAVLIYIGIPAAVFGILGNWIGSDLAIKNGSKVIKPVFLVVLVILFVKIGLELIH